MNRRNLVIGSFAGLASSVLTRCGGSAETFEAIAATPAPHGTPTPQATPPSEQRPLDPLTGVNSRPLATWIPAPGELRTLQTSNTFLSLRGNSLPKWDYRFGKIVDDFSGGVYNPYWGRLGAMVFHGGGHASTYDNSVLILDYNDLAFKRLSQPSPQSSFTHMFDDPLFNRDACEYADGQPGAGHTYDTLAILPPEHGGSVAGSLVRVSSHAVHVVMSCSTGWSHRFDMTPRVDRGSWIRWSANGPTSYRSPGACSAYDPKRMRFWWIANLSSLPPFIRYLDVASREHRVIRYATGANAAPPAQPNSMTMRYDSVRDILILSVTRDDILRIAYLQCEEPQAGWFTPTLSSEIPSRPGHSHPFDYVPETDRFVMLAPADAGAVYEMQVPATPSSTWTVTRRAFSNGGTIPIAHVAGKRWSYAPAVKSFVWLAKSSGPTVAYRPLGT